MPQFDSLVQSLLQVAESFRSFCEARVGAESIRLVFYGRALRYTVFLDRQDLWFTIMVKGHPLISHVLRKGRVVYNDPAEREPQSALWLSVGEFLWCVRLYGQRIVPVPGRQPLRPRARRPVVVLNVQRGEAE